MRIFLELYCNNTATSNATNPCDSMPLNFSIYSWVNDVLNIFWPTPLRYISVHDDVIKWTHFPRHWPFVRGIHRSPVNSPHKGQWRGALMFSFICAWINVWVNNREAGDLRRHRAHYDVIVMCILSAYFTVEYRYNSNITRYCIKECDDICRTKMTHWIHLVSPGGWAICDFSILEKIDSIVFINESLA